ncbi:hypothetical protein A8C32_11570 [Flavivirga aquatica]|uniref:4-hydroxybenzoate synthetase n=1 Tax=Flavivirga aquatica TaxID=1849968 RepID=A0A1E5TD98_9FLAO|nr:chorismate pyruvate-lyase family protein [Flavivirga aquatica]OEK09352.1 hypothetical protein A8C32_11570 [Flavivirga aquatica]
MIQSTLIERNEIIKVLPVNEILLEDNSLSLFQKTLLVTDGTVTDLLRLYTHKDITVKKITQEMALSGSKESKLCENETPILRREIFLGHENENYVYANSTFIFENMSQKCQDALIETDRPIGHLWKEEKIDTYRDIIEIRIELCDSLAPFFNVEQGTRFLARTYIISNNLKILGMITEKFPISYFNQ